VIQRLIAHVLGRAGLEFARHMGKILGQLFHEVTGFVFLALGLFAVPAVYKEWNGASKTRLWMACAFVLIMVYFGITSFVKARKAARHDS
jgi:hypothetical protein